MDATSGPGPLRPALKTAEEGDADRSSPKAVHIAHESPSVGIFRAGSAHRLCDSPSASPVGGGDAADEHPPLNRYQYYSQKLLAQVGEWLEHERTKARRRLKTPRRRKSTSPVETEPPAGRDAARPRADSLESRSSDVSLDRLQAILDSSLTDLGLGAVPRAAPKVSRPRRRGSLRSALQRAASSDTEYMDGDAIVPDCDAWLDNSKTLGCTSTEDGAEMPPRTEREREAWLTFKNDIIRIAHTLRLKGWRRVALEAGDAITVQRLSGALTNAVYVVTPPSHLPEAKGKSRPHRILLRVYGPQVEHLIDRDNELKVLQRLARKKIGPRLLGTFRNGRFEEYFNAITLRPLDIRDPDTSKQIAKRMRELHEGIELLPQERDHGPVVWKNWDQWLDNVAKVITYLDAQLERTPGDARRDSVVHAWKAHGYVCGVPWPQFRDAVAKGRARLNTLYTSSREIKDRLVFAHNDLQYGNILRLRPDDEKSPLLQAANKHKQLIVIDFEYAAANVPGLDIANHFTEWAYNYHDAVAPHACDADRYPTPDEQRRFIKAYVDHRPQFPVASSTPRMRPADGGPDAPPLVTTQSSSSITDFMLDARAPPGGWGAAECDREERSNQRVRELMDETRLWRLANSALWVAWGIVQATVPGLDGHNEPLPEEEALRAEEEAGVGDFDYLSYAQDRALFFWGDAVQMGLVPLEELPDRLRARIKMIDY